MLIKIFSTFSMSKTLTQSLMITLIKILTYGCLKIFSHISLQLSIEIFLWMCLQMKWVMHHEWSMNTLSGNSSYVWAVRMWPCTCREDRRHIPDWLPGWWASPVFWIHCDCRIPETTAHGNDSRWDLKRRDSKIWSARFWMWLWRALSGRWELSFVPLHSHMLFQTDF